MVLALEKLTPFQAARKCTAEMRGPTLAFLIDIGMTDLDSFYELFKGWVDLFCVEPRSRTTAPTAPREIASCGTAVIQLKLSMLC